MDTLATNATGSQLQSAPTDISAYARGNTGVPYVTTLESGQAGPHLMINALTHGNEVCGAHALKFLFESGLRPERGRLTLSFANVSAYDSFDEKHPGASRYLDEDFNRVWSPDVLDGKRDSRELARARALRPIVDQVDHLLDLHSMQTDSPPLALAGVASRGLTLARAVGAPVHIVVDSGHAEGTRLRDYDGFGTPDGPRSALLVECGQHWLRQSRDVAIECTLRFLLSFGAISDAFAAAHLPDTPPAPQRLIEVTEAVAVRTDGFEFAGPYAGLEVIGVAGTVVGRDGNQEIRTPYDDCVLVMPSRRLRAGQTAVRFGRYIS